MLTLDEVLGDFRDFAGLDGDAPVDVHTRAADGGTALHWMAYLGDDKGVELLAAHGADLNAQDAEGNTPLHEAVSSKQAAAVRALLACGADAAIKTAPDRRLLTWRARCRLCWSAFRIGEPC